MASVLFSSLLYESSWIQKLLFMNVLHPDSPLGLASRKFLPWPTESTKQAERIQTKKKKDGTWERDASVVKSLPPNLKTWVWSLRPNSWKLFSGLHMHTVTYTHTHTHTDALEHIYTHMHILEYTHHKHIHKVFQEHTVTKHTHTHTLIKQVNKCKIL